eukprot:1889674-Rhodomonas_salina.1
MNTVNVPQVQTAAKSTAFAVQVVLRTPVLAFNSAVLVSDMDHAIRTPYVAMHPLCDVRYRDSTSLLRRFAMSGTDIGCARRVHQSAAMYRYLEKRQFLEAYKVNTPCPLSPTPSPLSPYAISAISYRI